LVALAIPVLTQADLGNAPQARPVFDSGEAPAIENRGQQAVAGAEQQAGNSLLAFSDATLRAKEEFDHAEVMARISDLGKYKNNNIDNGALHVSGRDAIGITDRSLKDYDKATQDLEGTLTDRYQKTLFEQHVGQDRVLVQRQLLLHEHAQLDAQQAVDFESGLDSIASDAGLRWRLGSVVVDQAIGEGSKAIAARAAAKGWTAEQIQKVQRDWRSRVVASFVNNAASDPAAQGGGIARAVLGRYVDPKALTLDAKGQLVPDTKGLIDADVVKQLWHTVREASLRDTVNVEVQRIQAALPPEPVSGITPIEKQIDLARKTVKNTDALPEVESQLHQNFNIVNAERAQKDRALSESLILGLDEQAQKLQPLTVNKADPRWSQMTDGGRATVMQHLLALQSTERHERDQALQLARYDFYSRPPADRIRVRPAVDYPQLDTPGQQAMQHLVLDAQTAWAKDNGVTAEGVHSSIQSAADSMSYSKRQHGEFSHAVEERLARDFPKKDQPPTKQQVDTVIADELLYGRHGFFQFGETRWEAEKKQHGDWKPAQAAEQSYGPSRALVPGAIKATQDQTTGVRAIPPAMLQRIDASLKKSGISNPTDAQRLNTWRYLQNRGNP
jgi:hypothetical protein